MLRGHFTRGWRNSGKFLRVSKSWKEGGLLLPTPFPIFPTGLGRGVGRAEASFTTRPRAAMTIKRRMADSAGQSTRRTALWTERGSSATVMPPASSSMAKRPAMISLSASLLRLMAKSQSK